MLYPILTYSRNLGDFPFDFKTLHDHGLKAIRLIYKGKTEAEFNERIQEIQTVFRKHELEIDILIDLPGKKPIVRNLKQGLDVKAGEEYWLTDGEIECSVAIIPTLDFFNHESFPTLEPGDVISIADDELNLLVKEIRDNAVVCEAMSSFFLTPNRSLGLKNKPFPIQANSEAELQFVGNLQNTSKNVKLVVSFTRSANDLQQLKALQPGIELIPKIESILSDSTLHEIMSHCNSLMLGRGDLSLDCKPNELFAFQQRLIHLCKERNKQLIVGTGLLNGIGEKQSPTISEVMDYGYLRRQGTVAFLIAGSNALYQPLKTLAFMQEFDNDRKP